jgi:peptidoglycan/xylan/chitin deacetylase (PgdA/CDA1 family)
MKRLRIKYFVFLFIILIFSGCNVVTTQEEELEENIGEDVGTGRDLSTQQDEHPNLVKIQEEFKLPILLYHHIGNPPVNTSKANKVWYVSTENFEKDLKIIQELGYEAIFLSELLEYIDSGYIKENLVVIDFDDGAIDFYDNAWPLLQKYNMKSSMNLMTGVGGKNYLNKDQIKELDATELVEFQSHTVYHEQLSRASVEKQKEVLTKSKNYIEELLEKEVEVIAYPNGLYSEEVKNIASEVGYKIGMTIKPGVIQDSQDLFELKRNIITNSSNIRKILE